MWNKLEIDGITNIEKCVGEFDVVEIMKTQYYKLRLKIYEDMEGNFTGRLSLAIRDQNNNIKKIIGTGTDLEETLKATIEELIYTLNQKSKWREEEFILLDYYEF